MEDRYNERLERIREWKYSISGKAVEYIGLLMGISTAINNPRDFPLIIASAFMATAGYAIQTLSQVRAPRGIKHKGLEVKVEEE